MNNQKFNSGIMTITAAAMSAALITVCSWISIPALGPFVPFTLQTFAVFVIAGLFDLKTGFISIMVYLFMGAVGVPVFSGFKSGFAAITGPTGGYLVGFLFMIVTICLFKKIKSKSIVYLIIGMSIGLVLCYIFGTIWFYCVFAHNGDSKSFISILSICVIPFIIPDILKMTAAVILVSRVYSPLKKMGFVKA
ncbi:MAG: biotin transporter BioY [Clostridia bacterium]|nr:biotin transporter BioY [Clostridia bacterium]